MKYISAKNVALLVAAGLLAGTGTSVAADTTPAPTPTASAHAANQAARDAYKAAVAKYVAGRKAANDAFKSDLAAAKAKRDAALAALGAKPTPPVKASN